MVPGMYPLHPWEHRCMQQPTPKRCPSQDSVPGFIYIPSAQGHMVEDIVLIILRGLK